MTDDPMLWWFVFAGGAVMFVMLLRGVGSASIAAAEELINARRAGEARLLAANAIAESLGRAASLEPLNLNADGTIEEPILGVVENA